MMTDLVLKPKKEVQETIKEVEVTYTIYEYQYNRLLNLLDKIRNTESSSVKGDYPFKDYTLEDVFRLCMRTGSKYKVDESINEMELRFGIENNQSNQTRK